MPTASQPSLISPQQCQSPWIPSCCPPRGQPQLPWDPLPTTLFLHSSILCQAPFKWMGNAAAAKLLQAILPPLVPEAVQQKSPSYQVCKLKTLYTAEIRAGFCLVKLRLASAVRGGVCVCVTQYVAIAPFTLAILDILSCVPPT